MCGLAGCVDALSVCLVLQSCLAQAMKRLYLSRLLLMAKQEFVSHGACFPPARHDWPAAGSGVVLLTGFGCHAAITGTQSACSTGVAVADCAVYFACRLLLQWQWQVPAGQ